MNRHVPTLALTRLLMALAMAGLAACQDAPGEPSGGLDGGTVIPRECARPAPGCSCEEGDGPIRCIPPRVSDQSTCLLGDMYCRGGAWSGCESLRAFEDTHQGPIGGSTMALIGEATACDSCNPECANVVDAPDCSEVTAQNTTGETLCVPGGGFTIPPGAIPPIVPSCVEQQMGQTPGGSYEEFCAEGGSLILVAANGSGTINPSTEICADQLAADTFTQALCSCKNIDSGYALTTDSFNSVTGVTLGNTAHVYTNQHYRPGGRAEIGGDVIAFGTGTHNPGGQNFIQTHARFNGLLSTSRAFNVGVTAGDVSVNGNINFGAATSVGGVVRQPMGSTMTGGAGLTRVLGPVTVPQPCDCGAGNVIDIPGFVSAFRTTNDNAIIGLSPTAWEAAAGGRLTLPCGRFYLTRVNTGSSFTITATGRTALLIDGDLRTGAQLTIALSGPTAEVDVFVTGTVAAGAAITLGDPSRPASVRLYVGGSAPINFSGHGSFGGNFYAPNADVDFGGRIDVYGSLYVGKAIGTSNLVIHYDEGVLTPDCPPPSMGSYARTYDSSLYCGADLETRPDWGDFTWDADVPDGAELTFEFRTADTEAALATAPRVRLEVPPNSSPINVGDMLVAAGLENYKPFLRVTAVMAGNGQVAPVVRSFNTSFDCGFGSSGASDPGAFTCGGSPITCRLLCVAEICGDGVDNDCDGIIDCADTDCTTDPLCARGEICGNFIDDDGDGLVDFWDLLDCPCAAETCADGLDNDADGLVDCADTTNCPTGVACNQWGSTCSGGACVCPSGSVETSCSDGFDNDCDGFVDCGDADCIGSPGCECGDGTVDAMSGEECDEGGVESLTCDDDCTFVVCGDGTRNAVAGEECDTGGESAGCNADCTLTRCGDGYINTVAGETCEEGGVETATCNANCTTAVCGDGVVNATAGEECDEGAAMPSATCAACQLQGCGNGIAEAGEECDHGGESATCNLDCTLSMCGDGVVNLSAGEQCDDGGPSSDCDGLCQHLTTPRLILSGTFNTDTGLLNGASVLGWNATSRTLAWTGDVELPSGSTLVVTGSRPFVVTATGGVLIAGTLDASGTSAPSVLTSATLSEPGGAGGPGGGAGGRGGEEGFAPESGVNAYGIATGRGGPGEAKNNKPGGGGGGAGHATAGTAGAQAGGGDGEGGTAGASYTGFFGGAGGGGGGQHQLGGVDDAGGSGGGGGGAVSLTASGSLVVSGTISVRGGNGGNTLSEAAGGGGGSGGTIRLVGSTAPSVTGTLNISGGSGGAPRGGAGAAGVVMLSP